MAGDFSDPFLGIQQDVAMVNYNAPVFHGDSAAAEAAKQQLLMQQRKQQQVRGFARFFAFKELFVDSGPP